MHRLVQTTPGLLLGPGIASCSQCMLRLTADLLPNTIFTFMNTLEKSYSCLFPARAPGEEGLLLLFVLPSVMDVRCCCGDLAPGCCGHHRRSIMQKGFLGKTTLVLAMASRSASVNRGAGCTPLAEQPRSGSLQSPPAGRNSPLLENCHLSQN